MSHGITQHDHMFSVRAMPWHGLGVVLDQYPRSINEALDKAGLGWKVTHGDVLIVRTPEWTDDFGAKRPAELIPAKGFKANVREDTGEVLGIVSDEYEVVENREAFRFLDALIGSELHFETAGSLWGGRRVWCLARLPEYIDLGGGPLRDVHLRGQQPRRINGGHGGGDTDPDRVRQHALPKRLGKACYPDPRVI